MERALFLRCQAAGAANADFGATALAARTLASTAWRPSGDPSVNGCCLAVTGCMCAHRASASLRASALLRPWRDRWSEWRVLAMTVKGNSGQEHATAWAFRHTFTCSLVRPSRCNTDMAPRQLLSGTVRQAGVCPCPCFTTGAALQSHHTHSFALSMRRKSYTFWMGEQAPPCQASQEPRPAALLRRQKAAMGLLKKHSIPIRAVHGYPTRLPLSHSPLSAGLDSHFDPPLFNHANAEAPPTGLAGLVFASVGTWSLGFSPEINAAKGSSLPSAPPALLNRRLPSSKKRDWPVVAGDADCEAPPESIRVPGLVGFNTLIPVSRR